LYKKSDDDFWQNCDHRSRRHLPPENGFIRDETKSPYRGGKGLLSTQNKTENEVVPGENEGKNSSGCQAGLNEGKGDLGKDFQPRIAVNSSCLFDLDGDVLEIASHDPNYQGKSDKLVNKDHSYIGVVKEQHFVDSKNGDDHSDFRCEAKAEKSEGNVLFELEFKPCQRICGRNSNSKRSQDRSSGNDQAVFEIKDEVRTAYLASRRFYAEDKCFVVVQSRTEENFRHTGYDILVGFQGHEQYPNDRKEGEYEKEDNACIYEDCLAFFSCLSGYFAIHGQFLAALLTAFPQFFTRKRLMKKITNHSIII